MKVVVLPVDSAIRAAATLVSDVKSGLVHVSKTGAKAMLFFQFNYIAPPSPGISTAGINCHLASESEGLLAQLNKPQLDATVIKQKWLVK